MLVLKQELRKLQDKRRRKIISQLRRKAVAYNSREDSRGVVKSDVNKA